MKLISTLFFTIVLSVIPFVASAQIDTDFIQGYSRSIVDVVNFYLVPVLLALAFLVFIWGVFKNFFWKAESGEAHTEGSKFVAWGIIGFVIILSLWALVNIVQVTLGLTNTERPANLQPPVF